MKTQSVKWLGVVCAVSLLIVAPQVGFSDGLGRGDSEGPSEQAVLCLDARESGYLDETFVPTTPEQIELRRACSPRGPFTNFCVVNFDGDSEGDGFSGIRMNGQLEYGDDYARGTSDDDIASDVFWQVRNSPSFDATMVGDTTFVVEPGMGQFGMGCGPIRDDSGTRVGTAEYDWNSIIIVETDPRDSPDDWETNGSEPWTDVNSSFTVTTWYGSGTYRSGLDSDFEVCAGLYSWGPGSWEGVGWTALVQEAVGSTLSCSTNDPNMRIACRRLTR